MGDRGFCSFADLVVLQQDGVDSVFRVVQRKLVDFRRGRRLGPGDHLVTWAKTIRPRWMSPEEFDALPDEITVREIRFRVDVPGFRSEDIVLVTTLLDPEAYPAEAIIALYRDRWRVELSLRHLKITMQTDILRGKSPDIVQKEFWPHLLAYNLLRGLLWKAADGRGPTAHRLSVKGALQRLQVLTPRLLQAQLSVRDLLLTHLLRTIRKDPVPDRPNRVEPRARKRRPKQYRYLTVPRLEARRRLVG